MRVNPGWSICMAVLLLTACANQPDHPSTAPPAAPSTAPPAAHASDPVATPALQALTKPPAPDCDTGKVSARFVGGGYGGGNDFGAIVVWNSGPRPCQLRGSVGFAAYYPGGIRDPNATLVRPISSGPVRLPPFMLAPRPGQDLSGYLVGYLMGPERDDSSQPNGLCRKQDERYPIKLIFTIGALTLPVTNLDPGSVQVTSIYGCHGQVLLENLQAPNG